LTYEAISKFLLASPDCEPFDKAQGRHRASLSACIGEMHSFRLFRPSRIACSRTGFGRRMSFEMASIIPEYGFLYDSNSPEAPGEGKPDFRRFIGPL
jgi:hypothetical protein